MILIPKRRGLILPRRRDREAPPSKKCDFLLNPYRFASAPTVVTFDNQTTAGVSGGATSLTYSMTCSGLNRALMVMIITSAATVHNGITYAGVAMTQVGTPITSGAFKNSLWALSAPASGANNVVITTTTAGAIYSTAYSFTGANQTTASLTGTRTTNTGSTTSVTTGAVTSAAGELVIDSGVIVDAGTPAGLTPGASQNNRGDNGDGNLQGICSTKAGAASVSMSWTLSGGRNWAYQAVNIKQ